MHLQISYKVQLTVLRSLLCPGVVVYLLLCSFLVDRNDVVAPVVCPGTHGTNTRPITPTEPVQLLPMQFAHRVLNVLHHTDQQMASKIFIPVMWLEMSRTVRGHALQA